MITMLFILYLSFVIPYGYVHGVSSCTPKESITIDCGASGNKTHPGDDRLWSGDVASGFFLSHGTNTDSVASQVSTSSVSSQLDPVPYHTSRLSFSEFTYTIPLSPGPKFVRLHFFPALYGGKGNGNDKFDTSKAFFAVQSGGFTLLRNFSANLAAGALQRKYVVKEFCLVVSGSSLDLSFSPSKSSNGAFGFVNGIEVLSMPDNLYYPRVDSGLRFIGQKSLYSFGPERALAMMYRLNIGGAEVTPNQDTGFYRNWEGLNSKDERYLTVPGSSILPYAMNVNLSFEAIPECTAPAVVYRTGRVMGIDKDVNKRYNLTWSFEVDSGFYYMARLHLCEIVQVMNTSGDRVFRIYIDGQTAERRADVAFWSGGKYTPYFKDYIVWMNSARGEKKLNLSIALQASPHDWETSYTDAILNGVEIFKLSDTENNLAGPNTDPPVLDSVTVPSEPKRKKSSAKVGIIAGVVSGMVVIMVVVGVVVIQRRARTRVRLGSNMTDSGASRRRDSSTLPSELCRHFSLAEIQLATNNFDDTFIIGVGGFGNVYKGYIANGTTAVAIKRLKSGSSQGEHEFKTEIEMLSHLRHRHLVSLIGYCCEHSEMILVYEHMARGTLRHHLYKTDNPPLPWKQRLDACIGAAHGLVYLHAGAKHAIIHRDVKTTNILLDEKYVAKLSDFGLSKFGPSAISKAHVTTEVKGSIGYLDPEYYRRQQLSLKSDVYSFGVVLCEVLAGRPPIVRAAEESRKVCLAEWTRECHVSGAMEECVDPILAGTIAPECLKKFGEVAVSCMMEDGADRPSMSDVVWGLEFALKLQEDSEERVMGYENEVENDSSNGMSFTDEASCLMRSGTGSDTTNESMKILS